MTAVFFGLVDRYIADRGFGFVKNELPGKPRESYFFHISTLKKACPDLAISLEGGGNVGFWYDLEDTPNGKRALPLNVDQLNAKKASSAPLIRQIEDIWSGSDTPPWLSAVTCDLLGGERAAQLAQKREEDEKERHWLEQERASLEHWSAHSS